jgi:hypothetical protein
MNVDRLGNVRTRLKNEIVRLAYMPRNENGQEEYVLVFENRIPDSAEEPQLFREAVAETGEQEAVLNYPKLNTQIILLTRKNDDDFRKDNPEKVSAMETFRIDEEPKKGLVLEYAEKR